jgi:hypothetical protein
MTYVIIWWWRILEDVLNTVYISTMYNDDNIWDDDIFCGPLGYDTV